MYIFCRTGNLALCAALDTAAQMLRQTVDITELAAPDEAWGTVMRSSGGHWSVSMTQEGAPQS